MEKGTISVDRWAQGSQVYFLTHLHSDHTSGLSPTWKHGPLFCSRITSKLFPFKFSSFKLSLLRIVEIGQWHSLSLVSPSSGLEVAVEALAIDAHHCPGAVMYLFRGDFGCMLYTGDFRWESRNERAQNGRNMLINALKNEKVQTLYLDNTYCNPSYCFPSREVAAQQEAHGMMCMVGAESVSDCSRHMLNMLSHDSPVVGKFSKNFHTGVRLRTSDPPLPHNRWEPSRHGVVNIITSYPEHDIIIGIDSLGKEDLLVYVSRVLKIKICVWPERLQTMHLLGFDNIFTTRTSLTRVRAVPRYSFSIETLEGLNAIRPTIGIMPSGLPWLKTGGTNGKTFTSSPAQDIKNKKNTDISTGLIKIKRNKARNIVEKYHPFIYNVLYSDHSSFPEIEDFVKLLQPTNIMGIVSSSPSYVDPLYFLGYLCGESQLSLELNGKVMSKEERGRKRNFVHSSGTLTEGERKRKKRLSQVDFLGVRTSRVSLLRRKTQGVKLGNVEFSSD